MPTGKSPLNNVVSWAKIVGAHSTIITKNKTNLFIYSSFKINESKVKKIAKSLLSRIIE